MIMENLIGKKVKVINPKSSLVDCIGIVVSKETENLYVVKLDNRGGYSFFKKELEVLNG